MTDAKGPIDLRIEGGIAWASIDNPPINLLSAELFAALDALGREVEANAAVRVLVLRSADPEFFIAHADVGLIAGMPDTPVEPDAPLSFVHATLERFRTMPRVTIAQIEGFARGGGSEVALACDMRFAAIGKAVLGQPEIGLGILPGAGGTVRLTQLVGRARASEIIFGGDDVDALEAERLGWVNRALPADEVGAHVEALARRIASFPQPAIAEIKRVMCAVEDATPARLGAEQAAFAQCMSDPEARRRMRRFLEMDGQSREAERRLGARLTELAAS